MIINLKYINLKLDKLLNIIDIYDNKFYDIYIGKDCQINKYINFGHIFFKLKIQNIVKSY
jgi:hypothetical protein